MNQDDINRKRVADLTVLFGSPSTGGLRNKPTQLTADETHPGNARQNKVSSTLFTLQGTSKLIYMFAKATLRVNFTFDGLDGLPHFFFLCGRFN